MPGAGAAAGADALLPLATVAGSSPSAASTAIFWFTGTSFDPAGTRILARMPSSTASTSIVALSVSISAMMSPDLTRSPSFFSHLARLPFSIVGDRAGIRMSIAMEVGSLEISFVWFPAGLNASGGTGSVGRSGSYLRMSVQSSEGSGSGSWVANSAASFTISRHLASIAFNSSSETFQVSSRRRRTCSMGSRSSRIFWTSSLERYLAGSDIECPR